MMKCTLPEFLLHTIWQIRFISLSHSYVNSVVDFPTCLPLNDHGKKWKDVAVQGKSGKYYVSYIHLSYGCTCERAFFCLFTYR